MRGTLLLSFSPFPPTGPAYSASLLSMDFLVCLCRSRSPSLPFLSSNLPCLQFLSLTM